MAVSMCGFTYSTLQWLGKFCKNIIRKTLHDHHAFCAQCPAMEDRCASPMEGRGGGDKDADGGAPLLQGNHSRLILDDNMAAMSPGELNKKQKTTNSFSVMACKHIPFPQSHTYCKTGSYDEFLKSVEFSRVDYLWHDAYGHGCMQTSTPSMHTHHNLIA